MRYEEFVIEGRNAVLEAFRSGKTIDKVFLLKGCQDGPVLSIAREARKHDCLIQYVPKQRLDQMSETGKHQGVIAYAAAYEYASVEDMLELLSPIAEAVVTVRPDSPRAMGAEELAAQVRRRGIPACACESVEEGMRIAAMAAGQGGAVCALGSLYLAADVRRAAEAL